jgi:extracellular factor (EF) 3-hydroxypalmitic acid methyl ester biosynthesis protein
MVVFMPYTIIRDHSYLLDDHTANQKPATRDHEYLFDYLSHIVKSHGPNKKDYHELNEWIIDISNLMESPEWNQDSQSRLISIWGDAFSPKTMQGFAYHKPHGYAGDFEIIDRLYNHYVCPEPHLRKWDEFFQWHKAAEAVRNRKKYFTALILDKLSRTDGPLNILNLGSGPGRDMLDFYSSAGEEGGRVHFVCVEQDQKAIEFASRLCGKFSDRISFQKMNILNFHTDSQFDLVWAAGVFDYFSDRLFCKILKKLMSFTKTNGEIVIGNFSNNNPSRFYMKVFGWLLHYRSSQQLCSLSHFCGIPWEHMVVEREKTGVNLFLHINKYT